MLDDRNRQYVDLYLLNIQGGGMESAIPTTYQA